MGRLVGVAEQAVVAGTAALVCPAGLLLSRTWIEVAHIESLRGNPCESIRVFDQALPNAIASVGSFPLKQSAVLPLPDLLDCDLLLLNLKHQLHAALEGIAQSGKKLVGDFGSVGHRAKQKNVSRIPYKRPDPGS